MATSWKWTETDVGRKVQGKNGFTRFVGWLNSLFNEDHAWLDYDKMSDMTDSLANRYTDAAPTSGEVMRNEMQMQNVEDQFQRQVTGMQKAGLNPALMYQSGVGGSAPSVQTGSSNPASMSELMQLALLPRQMKMLDAQTRNIEADSQKKLADTEHVKQIIDWYPNVSEASVAEVWSKTGVNLQNINESEAKEQLTRAEKVIKDAEGRFAEDLQKAKLALVEAQTQEAKDSAAASAARAAFDQFELQYAKANNAKLSSSSMLAVISALTSWLGVNPTSQEAQTIVKTITDDVKHPSNMYTKGAQQLQKYGLDDRSIINKGKSLWNRFERWRNKEKRIRLF